MPWPDDLCDPVFMPHRNETLDELVLQVRIALGKADITACSAADANNDRQVTIDEIVRSVTQALLGCG
jgi:hypothetical protein